MTRPLTRFSLIGLLVLALWFESGCATVRQKIVVDPQGKGDFRTIREGLMNWQEGMAFDLKPGVYDEQVLLKSKLTLDGQGQKVVIRYTGEGPAVVGQNVSEVKLSGLVVQKSGGAGDHPAILLESADILIEGCRIAGARGAGIDASRYGNLDLKTSVIEGNAKAGVHLHHAARGRLTDVSLRNNGVGAWVATYPDGIPSGSTVQQQEEGPEVTILGSTFEGNSTWGLLIDMGSFVEIQRCALRDNGTGAAPSAPPAPGEPGEPASEAPEATLLKPIDLSHGGINVYRRSRLVFRHNTMSGHALGMVFSMVSGGEVSGNVFQENRGVVFYASSRAELSFTRNQVTNNPTGLVLVQGANALIEQNEISGGGLGIVVAESSMPRIFNNRLHSIQQAALAVLQVSRPDIRFNVVADNDGLGLLVADGSKPSVINNTFHANRKVAAHFTGKSEGTFSANVLSGNKVGLSMRQNGGYLPDAQANCFFENERDLDMVDWPEIHSSNFRRDPKFRDAAHGDFTPTDGSPLILKKGFLGGVDPRTPDARGETPGPGGPSEGTPDQPAGTPPPSAPPAPE